MRVKSVEQKALFWCFWCNNIPKWAQYKVFEFYGNSKHDMFPIFYMKLQQHENWK